MRSLTQESNPGDGEKIFGMLNEIWNSLKDSMDFQFKQLEETIILKMICDNEIKVNKASPFVAKF